MIRRIQVSLLKVILKVLGVIFNRSNEINNKLKELDVMKNENRVINEEDLDFKIFDDITTITKSNPTKEHFLFVKNKVDTIFKKTGYYPSQQQIKFFINEFQE